MSERTESGIRYVSPQVPSPAAHGLLPDVPPVGAVPPPGRIPAMRVTLWGPLPQKLPGMRHVFLGLLIGLLLPTVMTVVASLFQDQSLGLDARQAQLTQWFSAGPGAVASLLTLWVGFLSGVFLAGRLVDGGWRALVGWRVSWRQDLLIAVAATAALELLTVGFGFVVQHLGHTSKELGNTGLVTDSTGPWLVVLAVAATVGAPVVEELFFRGLFLTVATERFGAVAGVLSSSLVFGLMHVQSSFASSLFTVTTTATVGSVLAVLRLRTGRLGTTMLTHIVFNTTGVVLALLT